MGYLQLRSRSTVGLGSVSLWFGVDIVLHGYGCVWFWFCIIIVLYDYPFVWLSWYPLPVGTYSAYLECGKCMECGRSLVGVILAHWLFMNLFE